MRFPEFTEPWETAKLGAIAEFSKGTGISKEQRSETGLPCILYGELYTTYTNEVIEEVVSKTDLDPTDLVKSQKNDVVIPSSGETAEDIATARCVTSDNVLLGGDLNIIRLVEPNDGRFMSYQLNGIRKYDIAKIAQGVSVVHLYGGDLKMLSVTFPQSPEQKKIADCISLLDRRISVQSKLIEDLQQLKSAFRERIFYRIIKRFGRNVILSELLDYEQPAKYLISDTEYSNNSSLTPVLTANKSFILGYTEETEGIYNKGECIILDDFTLDSKYVDFPFKLKSSAIKILTAINKANLYYVYEYLQFLEMQTQEHARHYISEVSHYEISYPNDYGFVNEVACFLYMLTSKIKKETIYLKLLESQKQYLLKKMFI